MKFEMKEVVSSLLADIRESCSDSNLSKGSKTKIILFYG